MLDETAGEEDVSVVPCTVQIGACHTSFLGGSHGRSSHASHGQDLGEFELHGEAQDRRGFVGSVNSDLDRWSVSRGLRLVL